MMRFGEVYRLTLFGTSHGPEVGVEIEGIPRGRPIDLAEIQAELDRRSPVGRRLATKRREEDRIVVDGGLTDGRGDGGTLRAHVANLDVDRSPYEKLRETPRPGHADYPARVRFGEAADLSGGGIFSGRMTVGLVIAGAVARQLLRPIGIDLVGFARRIGAVEAEVDERLAPAEIRRRSSGDELSCPDPDASERMAREIETARRAGDSVGGIVEVRASGTPVGLGEPFFDSLESVIAHAALSIPGVKGIEFGAGFRAASLRGSEHNDPFAWDGERVVTLTNHAGGILGGLATGMPIVYRIAVKPTSSIARRQTTVDLARRTTAEIVVGGRHDPCIVPRAVPVAESVGAFALADLALRGGYLT